MRLYNKTRLIKICYAIERLKTRTSSFWNFVKFNYTLPLECRNKCWAHWREKYASLIRLFISSLYSYVSIMVMSFLLQCFMHFEAFKCYRIFACRIPRILLICYFTYRDFLTKLLYVVDN